MSIINMNEKKVGKRSYQKRLTNGTKHDTSNKGEQGKSILIFLVRQMEQGNFYKMLYRANLRNAARFENSVCQENIDA